MALATERMTRRDTIERARPGARAQTSIRHILVCLDRSPRSEACLPHAVAMARVFDARMTLLHVMQPAHAATQLRAPDPLGWEIARREAQAYLDGLREQTADLGPATEALLAQGDPAARIVSAAVEVGADLTVLGSHGEGGHVGGPLGSTVLQVLAVTRGSVFVARGAPGAKAEATPKRILVPLDGSTRTECVLPAAARIAQTHGGELVLVHVVSEPVPSTILAAGNDLELARELARRLESGAERYLGVIAGQLAAEGLAVRSVVLREVDERQALLELSEREHADLIVVAAHGATCNPARSFGTVASYLLSHGPTELLVIQDLREPERETSADVLDRRHAAPLRGAPHTGPAEGN